MYIDALTISSADSSGGIHRSTIPPNNLSSVLVNIVFLIMSLLQIDIDNMQSLLVAVYATHSGNQRHFCSFRLSTVAVICPTNPFTPSRLSSSRPNGMISVPSIRQLQCVRLCMYDSPLLRNSPYAVITNSFIGIETLSVSQYYYKTRQDMRLSRKIM